MALLWALTTLLAACGGGGSQGPALTIPQYFQQLEALIANSNQRSVQLDAQAQQRLTAATSPEEQLAAFREGYAASLPILGDLLKGVKDLSPPAEVADMHKAYVDALSAVLNAFQELNRQVKQAPSYDEAQAAASDYLAFPESQAIGTRFSTSCTTLEQAAASKGITIHLDCKQAAAGG